MANDTAVAVPTTELTAEAKAKVEAEAKAKVEALKSKINSAFDNKIDATEVRFNFKTIKEVDKDGKETGVETKRPSVDLILPLVTLEGVVNILEDQTDQGVKNRSLLLETVRDVQIQRAREIVNEKEDVSQDNFPLVEVTWTNIANLPKAERRGPGIPKETWEEFGKDYTAVMPAVNGKNAEATAMAVKLFLTKFNTVKTNKPVLNKMKEYLTMYLNSSPNAETYMEAVEFLLNKIDNLLKVDDAAMLENL